MTKIREPKKYSLGKYRFREVYYFALQYNEWQQELKHNTDTVKSRKLTGMPGAAGAGDETERLAIRRVELRKNMETIEQAAIETDPELYQYILLAVTNEWATYNYLKTSLNIPCGKNSFYDRRRKFYWILSQKK